MPKVKFIKPWTVKQGDGKGPVYEIGDVVELERSYADKYKNRGLAVDYVPEQTGPAALNLPLTNEPPDRGTVEIAEDWRDLPWPEMRALASRVTDDAVKSKDDAIAAIELELERRTLAQEGDQKEPTESEE